MDNPDPILTRFERAALSPEARKAYDAFRLAKFRFDHRTSSRHDDYHRRRLETKKQNLNILMKEPK